MMKNLILFLLICNFTVFLNDAYSQQMSPKNHREQLILSLTYGIDVEFMMSEAEGYVGPSAFSVNHNQTKLLVADTMDSKLKIFDLKTAKLLFSIDTPHTILEQVSFSPNGNIYYMYHFSESSKFLTIIRKISQDGKILFEVNNNNIPKNIQDKIQAEYIKYLRTIHENISEKPTHISWRYFSVNDKEELFVSALSSVLKYNSGGKLLGISPGMGYSGFPYLLRLDSTDKSIIGGKLTVFTNTGQKIYMTNIPKDRTVRLDFQEKNEYYQGPLIEIAGVDKNKSIYLRGNKKPSTLGLDSYYDIIIYKFDRYGNFLWYYLLPGSLEATMKKEIQVTPDGSIYYWKYFEDRMELWRILPQ